MKFLLAKAKITSTVLAMVCLIFLVGVAYHQSPQNSFHFDDGRNIFEHAPIRISSLTIGNLLNAARKAYLPSRPLPSLTFALDWWRGGGQPSSFQWTNVVIHTLTALAVFGLLLLVLQRYSENNISAVIVGSLFGAAAWAVHPIQIQAVTYIVQRMTSMAALFSVLSVFCYLRWRMIGRWQSPWLFFSALSFVLGVISKEIAWIIPFLLILAEFGVFRHGGTFIRSRLDLVVLTLPFLLLIFLVADLLIGFGPFSKLTVGYAHRDFTMAERLLTQPRVILFHFSQFLWPLPQRFSISHDFPTSVSLLKPATTWLALSALLAWCTAGMFLIISKNYRIFGFYILWVPATLAIESSFVPLEMVFEHRMYLPTVGVAGLLSLAAYHAILQWDKIMRFPVFAAQCLIVILLLAATLQQLPVWRTELRLFENAVKHAPRSARAWGALGIEYLKIGKSEKAKQILSLALRLNPEEPIPLEGMAAIMLDEGDLYSTRSFLQRAEHVTIRERHTLTNLWGELNLQAGDNLKALQLFKKANQLAPWAPVPYWNLAVTYERLGNCNEALKSWKKYLENETSDDDRELVRDHIKETYGTPSGKCYN